MAIVEFVSRERLFDDIGFAPSINPPDRRDGDIYVPGLCGDTYDCLLHVRRIDDRHVAVELIGERFIAELAELAKRQTPRPLDAKKTYIANRLELYPYFADVGERIRRDAVGPLAYIVDGSVRRVERRYETFVTAYGIRRKVALYEAELLADGDVIAIKPNFRLAGTRYGETPNRHKVIGEIGDSPDGVICFTGIRRVRQDGSLHEDAGIDDFRAIEYVGRQFFSQLARQATCRTSCASGKLVVRFFLPCCRSS